MNIKGEINIIKNRITNLSRHTIGYHGATDKEDFMTGVSVALCHCEKDLKNLFDYIEGLKKEIASCNDKVESARKAVQFLKDL
jgi:hypothetical protein